MADERRAQERQTYRDDHADPLWDFPDRVATDQGLEDVRKELDSGHLAALGERCREEVAHEWASSSDQDDLPSERFGPDLAAERPVVGQPREGLGAAPEVDPDLRRAGQRGDSQSRPRYHLVDPRRKAKHRLPSDPPAQSCPTQ